MTKTAWCVQKTQVLPLAAPLIQPFRTALGDHNTLDNLLFVLKLPDGTTGYGEAAVAAHITGETREATRRNLAAAGRWLQGQDARDYLVISEKLHRRWGKNPAAIAAVETALVDALMRKLKTPLWRFFGTRPARLRTDITIVIAPLAETEARVRHFYRRGFRNFKVKVGRDFDLDVKRVAAVRRLAPRSDIYLDANQGFSARETLKFLKELKRLNIRPALLEQPVACTDFEGLKKVSRATRIPVCADESARSIPDVMRIIKEKAASVINVKLMKFGVMRAIQVAVLARVHGLDLMISGMMESSLAMTAAAHLAAGLRCFSYIDLDTALFIRGRGARGPYLSAGGIYDLRAARRGIGVIPKT